MPRYRDGFPRPKREYHHAAWRIVWRYGGKKYVVSTTVEDKDAIPEIESCVRDLGHQLASTFRQKVSPPWKNMPGMMRYLADRYGEAEEGASPGEVAKWIADYRHEIKGKNTPGWVRDSVLGSGAHESMLLARERRVFIAGFLFG